MHKPGRTSCLRTPVEVGAAGGEVAFEFGDAAGGGQDSEAGAEEFVDAGGEGEFDAAVTAVPAGGAELVRQPLAGYSCGPDIHNGIFLDVGSRLVCAPPPQQCPLWRD